MENTIISYLHAIAEKNSGEEHRSPADADLSTHIYAREDGHLILKTGRQLNVRQGADLRAVPGRRVKKIENPGKSNIGIVDLEKADPGPGRDIDTRSDDHGARLAAG
jgi:hypothetical protein